jgi:DNA recombination protein RmuC
MPIAPEILPHAAVALVLGVLLGTLGTTLVLRQRHRTARREIRHSAELAESRLNQELASAREALEENRQRLAEAEAKAEALVARNAMLEEKSSRLPELARDLADLRQHQEKTAAERHELERRLTAVSVRGEAERRQTAEQIADLKAARREMKTVFGQLAEEIFSAKSREFNDLSKASLEPLLNPLQEQLGEFRRRVEAVYDTEVRDRTALKVEVAQLKELNERIGADALNLTRALKGESKVRGQWGELILARSLEAAGLSEGREFETQVSLEGGSGRRFQPDVVVRLPGGKDVVIDAKVSLVAYERYHRSEDTETREEALKAHLQSVRRHVQELSAKDYAALEGIRSLDFVLMFIPVEGAFELVLEKAPELFEQAFERNIVLVSGTTLLVTLRTIRHAWRDLQQSRNAQAIAREAGLLYDKFVGFTEALELVGRQLDKARQAHRQARDRLVSGRGNLLGRTQRLLDLGVKAKKQLPAEIEKMAADNPAADEGRRNG